MATLPSSGALAMSDINAEFGLGNDLNSYRGVSWFTDAAGAGAFSSGAISMSEFSGKRGTYPATIANPNTFDNFVYAKETTNFTSYFTSSLTLNTDGTWSIDAGPTANPKSGNWASPTNANQGVSRYVRFTRTTDVIQGTAANTSSTASTGWQLLTTARSVAVSVLNTNNPLTSRYSYWTVEIATTPSGGNIVSTSTAKLVVTYPEQGGF